MLSLPSPYLFGPGPCRVKSAPGLNRANCTQTLVKLSRFGSRLSRVGMDPYRVALALAHIEPSQPSAMLSRVGLGPYRDEWA